MSKNYVELTQIRQSLPIHGVGPLRYFSLLIKHKKTSTFTFQERVLLQQILSGINYLMYWFAFPLPRRYLPYNSVREQKRKKITVSAPCEEQLECYGVAGYMCYLTFSPVDPVGLQVLTFFYVMSINGCFLQKQFLQVYQTVSLCPGGAKSMQSCG